MDNKWLTQNAKTISGSGHKACAYSAQLSISRVLPIFAAAFKRTDLVNVGECMARLLGDAARGNADVTHT